MDTCIHACHSAYGSQSTSCMELVVSIRSVDSRYQTHPIKPGDSSIFAEGSLMLEECNKR